MPESSRPRKINKTMPIGAKKAIPQTPPRQMNPEQKEAMEKLVQGAANFFKGGAKKQKPYTSVAEALETIGLKPRILPVMVGDESVECLAIPVQELMHKEWSYLTGFTFDTPQTEEQQ